MNRRNFVAAGLAAAALALLPAPVAAKAPFASDRITVKVAGEGRDVVLIPGLTSSPRVWTEMVEAVPGYRYHMVQVSGFAGRPAGANAEGPVSAPVAEEIARYIKDAGLRKPAVIGHSMGGTIGMMLAARHPESLSRLMVVDMMPFLGIMLGGATATPESVKPIADGIRAQMRANTDPEARRKTIEGVIASMVNTESMRAGAIEDGLKSDPVVGANAYHELLVTDLRPEFARLTAPTTVLYVTPRGTPMTDAQIDAAYQALYAGLKGVVLKRAPDAAHFIMWDNPDWFQAEVRAFLG